MEQNSAKTDADGTMLFAGEAWFDPIEAGIWERVRGFIEEVIGQELDTALGRGRYERDAEAPKGYRNGTRERQLLGSFGPVEISVPRAQIIAEGGGTKEWRSATLPLAWFCCKPWIAPHGVTAVDDLRRRQRTGGQRRRPAPCKSAVMSAMAIAGTVAVSL